MLQTPRLLLIAPPTMTRTPAFERAAALAVAMQLPLHIVAFDYLQALAVAGLRCLRYRARIQRPVGVARRASISAIMASIWSRRTWKSVDCTFSKASTQGMILSLLLLIGTSPVIDSSGTPCF